MRSFIAASIGAITGFLTVFALAVADASIEEERLPRGDVAYFFFAFAWCIEAFAVTVLCMYRVSPWVARALLDDWEAERIEKAGRIHRRRIEITCSLAIVIRRAAQTIDIGHLTLGTVCALILAVIPFIFPSSREKKA